MAIHITATTIDSVGAFHAAQQPDGTWLLYLDTEQGQQLILTCAGLRTISHTQPTPHEILILTGEE